MTPYAQSLLDSMFGEGCNGERALAEFGVRNEYGLVCGCCGQSNFEWGHKSLLTGRCKNCGTLHYNDQNYWRIAV